MILKSSGINAQKCATGFRLASMIQNLGVDEDNFGTFISEIYQRCSEIGLRPQKIADNVKQLLMLSESIPLWQIPQYIADKTSEKRELEEDIRRSHEQESQARCSLEISLKERDISATQLNKFWELRTRLEKTGLSLDDIEAFAKAVEGAKELGYNPQRLVTLVSNFDASSTMQSELEKSVNSQTIKLKQATNDCARAERVLERHYLTISKYKKLEEMGFGLPMLTTLHDTIHEVANENKISHELAVQKFLNDIAENFSPILGYEGKLIALKSEIEKKKSDLTALSTVLDSKKEMAKVLPLLFLTDQYKINDLPSSLQFIPNNKQNQVASSTAYEGLNRPTEDLKQNIELAKNHIDLPDFATAIANPANLQRRSDYATWNAVTFVGVGYSPYPNKKDLEDMQEIREMQELALSRKSNMSQAGGVNSNEKNRETLS